jgi:hypothetical protein
MATPIKFFVEDKTMQKFIIDFVQKHFGKMLSPEKDFVRFKSWSEFGKEHLRFSENTDKGGLNLLFVDADNNFEGRIEEVKRIIDQHKISCEFFLFPDHASLGNMEFLLDVIATNIEAKDCYVQFEKCLTAKNLRLPSGKTKVYTYAEVLTDEAGRKQDLHKDPDRDYLNDNWNMEHEMLRPLHKFLEKFLSQ